MLFDINSINLSLFGYVIKPSGFWHRGRSMNVNMLIIPTDGAVDFLCGGKKYSLSPFDALLVPAGIFYRPLESSGCTYYVFHFEALQGQAAVAPPTVNNHSLPTGQFACYYPGVLPSAVDIPALAHISDRGHLNSLLNRMRTLKNGQDGKLLLNALFHELLIHVSRSKTVHALPLLDSMTSYIDQNKGGQVSLALLSDVFGVSESYIARLFKVNKGSTVSEYVNGVKIAAACDRLTADHTPIGKISDSLGFYNAYYFSRVFKKIVGVTPSQFRRNAREIL